MYAYLVCVDAVSNHNKYYEAIENADGSISVNFGRVGASSQHHTYAKGERQFASLIRSKEQKGYVQVDKQINAQAQMNAQTQIAYQPQTNPVYPSEKQVADFAENLLRHCRSIVKGAYRNYKTASPQMIALARRYLRDLTDETSLREFNQTLLSLFAIIPRRMNNVGDYCAKSINDFPAIIQKEHDLLDKLEAVLANQTPQVNRAKTTSNTAFSPLTYAEEDEIRALMKERKDAFVSGVRVNNPTEATQFELCKAKVLKNDIRLLFHGSDVGNWWSIANIGLKLNGARFGASYTGSGLGNGIYFADDINKSLNYCSGAERYIGIYEVNVGKMKTVTTWGKYSPSSQYDSIFLDGSKGATTGRRNEYCVYKEGQAKLKYIICCERERYKDISVHVRNQAKLFDSCVISPSEKRICFTSTFQQDMKAEYDMDTQRFTVKGQKLTPDEEKYLFEATKRNIFESDLDFERACEEGTNRHKEADYDNEK